MKFPWLGLMAGTALTLSAAFSLALGDTVTPKAVATHYANMAEAMYGDARAAAADLQKAVDALVAKPSQETLDAARKAWLESRPWYQQTEGFRFGNAIVDDWEGRVNAWPLDEGLIDYVNIATYGEESDENVLYAANVIANPKLTIGTETIDASAITPDLIKSLHEAAELGGKCLGRLPRHRVPALGPGPERHRPRRRKPSVYGLRSRQLHQRQLRAPCRLPQVGNRPPRG